MIQSTKVYIYPTDREWFRYLSGRPGVDEVNFWRPGGLQPFRQLRPGDLFLFRFGRPDNAIVGGGTYTHFSFAPLFQVWEAFGQKNGTADYDQFLRLIARYKKLPGLYRRGSRRCRLLEVAFPVARRKSRQKMIVFPVLRDIFGI